jgi:hypothetical protein
MMSGIDPRALRVAAEAYVAARRDQEAAKAACDAAYERLEASRDTLEYEIDWETARREEAAAAWRLRRAEETYHRAGGYVANRGA